MTAEQRRPSNEDRIRAARWFAAQGFGVFPCWSTYENGTCRCPAGGRCISPGKHPITTDGFKSATTDPTRIETFLSAASSPNYGLVPPEGVFILDVDGEGWQDRVAELEREHGPLPTTIRVATAHGQHIFLRWPDGHPRPLKQLFGWVTRWGSGSHAGYVIGPRSVHASGTEYRPADDETTAIATLPEAWATAGVTPERVVTVSDGRRFDRIPPGGRHDFLRDRARTLRGGGLEGEALFSAVMTINERYCDPPKSGDEVRQAIGDVETKYEPDPLTSDVADTRGGTTGMLVAEDPETAFPAAPRPVAFEGTIGRCVEHLLDGTDASPVGLLASLVSFCGALMPAWGYWHGRHPSSPFLALVGRSGDGRKGTAMYRVRDALGHALGIDVVNRVRFDGVASGEGLVKALLERTNETFGIATGILFEEEYATFLAAAGREGSNLDARMRSAFDGKQLSLRKVGEKLIVPEPYYLSGLVAITPTELQRVVQRESFTNGSGNRWLWLPVQRRPVRVTSTEPIFPVDLTEDLIGAHRATFNKPARIDPTPSADELLSDYDDYLRANATGTAARMTRRFGVLAFRMGLIHASVERSPVITRDHIIRAIALTDYALRGLTYAFGHAAGDADATLLLRMLRDSDTGELSQTDLKRDFLRDPLRRQAAIDDLQTLGLADVVKVRGRGRPVTVLRVKPHRQDFEDFGALRDTSGQEPDDRPKGVPKGSERGPEGVRKDFGDFGTPSTTAPPDEALDGRSHAQPRLQEGAPKVSERGPKARNGPQEGAPKVSQSLAPASQPPPTPRGIDAATGEVWCEDWEGHRSSHRGMQSRPWCAVCTPGEEPDMTSTEESP